MKLFLIFLIKSILTLTHTQTLNVTKDKNSCRLMEREPKLEVEDKLDVLRRSINLEITESARFEQMLQEAIDTA